MRWILCRLRFFDAPENAYLESRRFELSEASVTNDLSLLRGETLKLPFFRVPLMSETSREFSRLVFFSPFAEYQSLFTGKCLPMCFKERNFTCHVCSLYIISLRKQL